MIGAELSPDRRSVTVCVPLAIHSRGGRKQVVAPDGTSVLAPCRWEPDSTLVKALARAFRWRRLLEDGSFATIVELAAAEKINGSYVSRVLRLTLLSPDIVEAMLDGQCGPELTMAGLFRPFTGEWEKQRWFGLNV